MKIRDYFIKEKTIDTAAKLIKKNCKPFLTDWGKLNSNKPLYTGRAVSGKYDFIKKSVTKDRNPWDMPLELHGLLDNWFYKKFKVKARSNTVLATFNKTQAEFSGNTHLIFPIGEYSAISSQKIKDLYLYFVKIKNSNKTMTMYELYNKMIQLMDDNDYQKKLLRHDNEIMITCKKYYLVSLEMEHELLTLLK
jgi:hypothetical protein